MNYRCERRCTAMFAGKKRRLTEIISPLLEDGEVMVHLIAGSVRWVITHLPAELNPIRPLGTVEFGVLSDRRLWVFASDLQGRPVPNVLLEVARKDVAFIGSGGGYIRWVELNVPGYDQFRLSYP